MERGVSVTLLCLLGLGLMQSKAFEVEIKDASNKTCIYASMRVNFTIQYETNSSMSKNTTFEMPGNATASRSHCNESEDASLLFIQFGNGHTWSLSFTKNNTMYHGSALTVTYNTNDTALFPDALRKGLITSTTNFLSSIPLNTSYRCVHSEAVAADNVSQIFWNVTLQAFVQNGVIGREVVCDADKPAPIPSTTPTSPPATTPTPPTPTPTPVGKPAIGNYSVANKTGTCFLATMGLQLNVSRKIDGKNIWLLFNIDPNITRSSGSCSNDTATLSLSDNSTTMEFAFAIKKNNFYLQDVNVTMLNGSEPVSKSNNNLSFWEASVGSSYLCHKEQTIAVSEGLYINTFDVRIQPFGVRDGKYSTAEECFADSDLSFLIPIAVGAILLFLIILVLLSYLIGRRKSRTGYQSV
ncbi:lysosome-associated membrane glycoprotein 2 isoform X4 [Ascaphus truei]|uniref:lysosome-associated membrane glycoprotein 2 isoform X4 n=1 Tax=Ascaphus truei TaxID=8439 RepID=UPI003F5A8ACF